jgi:hypothetical protein
MMGYFWRRNNLMSEKQPEKGQKNVHHQRGCGLTGFLILVIILGVGRSLLYYYLLKQDYERDLVWVLPVLFILSLVTLLSGIGMWNWKRWGLYLYAGSALVSIAAGLILTGSIFVVFYELLPIAILGSILGQTSKYFE